MIHLDNPFLIIIRGLPGSGKTYLAHELQKEFDGSQTVMLDPDATDYTSKEYADHVKKQTEEGVDPKLHAYRFLRAQAHQGILSNKIIIWNQPFTNLEMFDKVIGGLRTYASDHQKSLSVLVVEMNVGHKVAKARIEERKRAGGHGPSDNTFTRFVDDYKSVAERGYQTVAVNGQDDVSASVMAITNAMKTS